MKQRFWDSRFTGKSSSHQKLVAFRQLVAILKRQFDNQRVLTHEVGKEQVITSQPRSLRCFCDRKLSPKQVKTD